MVFRRGIAQAHGFALVITLTLMILISVLALGLIQLCSITLRSSYAGNAKQTARANARFALMMLAVGELQRTVGPNTRVTARADILDEANPPLLVIFARQIIEHFKSAYIFF